MTLRLLPGPFFGWLGLLMFLLVMQFLIMYLRQLVGKGLPIDVLIELVAYNLAYMLVLAVPMATLIAVLTTFGRLAETGTYSVLKSSGVSFLQIVWPFLIVAGMISAGMGYFNSIVLPEANFRARTLWNDIRSARPGFALEPGVFYGGLDGYSILVRRIPPEQPSALDDVLIYDYTDGPRLRTDIKADRGTIRSLGGGRYLELELFDGEIHRRRPQTESGADRYERFVFSRHRMRVDAGDFDFRRSDPALGRRNDRTMPASELGRLADSLDASVIVERENLGIMVAGLGSPMSLVAPQGVTSDRAAGSSGGLLTPRTADRIIPEVSDVTSRIDSTEVQQREQRILDLALQEARMARTRVENARRNIQWATYESGRYRVELYKKGSLAVACLIFMLIAAPLGLSIRRGSLGATAILALFIFLFYWVALVIGEKQADRGHLSPWLGMWMPNIVGGVAAIWLFIRESLDRRATTGVMRRLFRRFRPIPVE